MTTTRSTRSALVSSILVLVLCLTSLLGTTFAWFTDSVTSAGNIIKTGTLDVTMDWADGTEAVPAVDSADWADASEGAIFNYELWEPGYVAVRHIKIANEGTLALKYQLSIEAYGEIQDLTDVIDVYYLDPAQQIADRADLTDDMKLGTLTDVLAGIGNTAYGELPAGENHTVTLALKMNEEAGNEYQDKTVGASFAIKLLATQLTAEEDSFGSDYDADAAFPSGSVEVATADELVAAIANGGDILLTEDVALNQVLVISKPTVINGNGKTITSSAARAINVSGVNGVTIKDLTVEASGERAINVIQGASNIVLDNVTAKAANYTVNVAASAAGAVVVINNSNLTGLNTVNIAGAGADVTIDNTTLNTVDNTAAEGYASICLNKDAVNGKVVATNTTINVTGSYANDSYIAKNGAEYGYISVNGSTDGVKVDNFYISYGSNYYAFATLEDAIAFVKDGETIGLIRDVELTKTVTIAGDKSFTLDLNGKTISGTFSGTGNQDMFLVKGNLTVKNGEITMTATQNQGWEAMTTIFDITAGGVLNLDNVIAENKGGTDMNFVAHLNNWGEVTLNVENSTLKATYVAVRVFNSGFDMNNVTIKNSTLEGGRSFWVHNYTSDDFGGKLWSSSNELYDEAKVQARLNFDIYGNGNTFVYEKAAVRYGMTNSFNLDENGNLAQ